MRSTIVAVIVSYQPDSRLARAVRSLARQVSQILVVDNASRGESQKILHDVHGAGVEILRQPRNLGVGAAHNIGISAARARGASHVLLMDQDSVPQEDMVANLLAAERQLLSLGVRLGAVGPAFYDPRLKKVWPFYRLSRFGVYGQPCAGDRLIACDFLISSGMLVRLSVLDLVGAMNEDYFLEHVDTEWSLRARHHGYRLYGACSARMEHLLGDNAVRVPLTGQWVQLYKPERHYYLFRNAMLLWREPYAPRSWKRNELRRLMKRIIFLSLFVPPRLQRARMMLLGLWHGRHGKTGQLRP